jgi:hypothetical protein
MADGFKIDLRKLGGKLPDGVRRAGRKLGKAAEKPLAVATAIHYPEDLFHDQQDRLAIRSSGGASRTARSRPARTSRG